MRCYGVRGAITVEENTPKAILEATSALLTGMIAENGIGIEDIASIIFTATPDLDAVYPALAAREMGWSGTPLLCMQETAVKGSLGRCIRVLMHWNPQSSPGELRHLYLGGAEVLKQEATGAPTLPGP
jgi:chorismate mutase